MGSDFNIQARVRLIICGGVQGVGFRPFIYRLAQKNGLHGWVMNTPQGVTIEVEGGAAAISAFVPGIALEKPLRSFILSMESVWITPQGAKGFEIRASDSQGKTSALVLPDIATCPDCLKDILNPQNRRHGYPFTNCTQCGPRFSIITSLPYDRPNTSMGTFVMCADCRHEYDDPLNRRFHAQPNACTRCGPHLEWWDGEGRVLCTHYGALDAAVAAITGGAIIALKGLGGFQLLADATNQDAVLRLRAAKQREEKPFAIMESSLEEALRECEISELEQSLLCSPESPIVLLRRRPGSRRIAPAVAPGNPILGVMLPYTPLHHLVMRRVGRPVVATSGNRADEPICTDEYEALGRLRGIADFYLVHNRPIARHVDDSIARIMLGRISILRRARGYAPLPVQLTHAPPHTVALGAHMKSAVALSVGKSVFVSQHLGDLESTPSLDAFHHTITDFQHLYAVEPEVIVADGHPDYLSVKAAPGLVERTGSRLVTLQHHLAHILSCMADNELPPPVLGVAWDGTGYGLDGTIWGGEFLRVTPDGVERFAHMRCFPLPGGDAAAREPRRSALGLLYAIYGGEVFGMTDLAPLASFSATERAILETALLRKINTPITSSMGRLFDAVASLIGLRQKASFEGQAAMECEWISGDCPTSSAPYPFTIRSGGNSKAVVLDWEPMIRGMIANLREHRLPAELSARFHRTLAEMILRIARLSGLPNVVLSGGCFQNESLLTHTVRLLKREGYSPFWHQRIPPNDGGIALGQVAAMTMEIPNPWKRE